MFHHLTIWIRLCHRDSFANIVDLLDDMFERAAAADEPIEMNFVKKHASELSSQGVERPAARLFSNPPGKSNYETATITCPLPIADFSFFIRRLW